MAEVRVSIVGAAGYTGGEALRLLLGHPEVSVAQVTSQSRAGQPIHIAHPNLRRVGAPGTAPLQFCAREELAPCDALLLCLPHGEAAAGIDHYLELAPLVIDLSADFRLRDPELYARWYGRPHPRPDLLGTFVYGLPELHREQLRGATRISGVGCNATAAILGLYPLIAGGLVDPDRIVAEAKVGSSEGGATAGPDSHHPERSGALRSYAPVGHRHTAEIVQELRVGAVHLSATAVEAVRGILVTAHCFLREDVDERRLWQAYRAAYSQEPFVRIVKERHGLYRYPEPKILSGSNYCDVGFALDRESGRVVVLSALDNLMKGAAGSAVQCLNIALGWPERLGLEFPGLHP
ncbi:MAG TPA: N-acetyl-gamma-glutamyl-phosphate reductase [Chloroflexota bacterium]|nr:N-acetyl-gamma-glutamyl-phosphate reductase [Chloroflexota bacterium]